LIVMKEPILIETNLFEHREVKLHFINSCCFGEDFAAWLKQELSRRIGGDFQLSEIIQEDWGWGFWARHSNDPFWIGIGYVAEVEPNGSAQWGVFVEFDYGLNIFKRVFHRPDPSALATLETRIREVLATLRS
jgi:hypothetical protein